MNKAILVLDMPNCCNECYLMVEDEYSYYCPIKCEENKTDLYDNYIMFHRKPYWCPLQKIPKKKEYYIGCSEYTEGCVDGWNECIEYLTE